MASTISSAERILSVNIAELSYSALERRLQIADTAGKVSLMCALLLASDQSPRAALLQNLTADCFIKNSQALQNAFIVRLLTTDNQVVRHIFTTVLSARASLHTAQELILRGSSNFTARELGIEKSYALFFSALSES